MIRNNQNGRRRGRGGGASGGGGARPPQGAPSGGNYSPNRGDNRQRGNANQLLEKYKSLARDASQQGDRVTAEYFMQYADHYYRVLNDYRVRENEARPQARRDNDDEGDEGRNYNNGNFNAASDAAPNYGAQSYAARAVGSDESDSDGDDGADDEATTVEVMRDGGREAGRDAGRDGGRDGNRDNRPRDRNRTYSDNNRDDGQRNDSNRNDRNRHEGNRVAPPQDVATERAAQRPRRESAPVVADTPLIQGLPPKIEAVAESDDAPAAPRRGRGRPRKVVAVVESSGDDAEG